MEDDQRLHTLVHEVTLYGLRFTIARSRKTAVFWGQKNVVLQRVSLQKLTSCAMGVTNWSLNASMSCHKFPELAEVN